MKEFYLTADKMLTAGLPPEPSRIFSKHLDECENLVVRAGALISPDYYTQPTVDSATWPLPQLFRHRGSTYVIGDDSLHVLNETTFVAGAAISTVNGREDYTPTTAEAVDGAGPWTFIDLGVSWLATNKNSTLFFLSDHFNDKYCSANHINLYAGTRHMNRLFLGGFSDRSGETAFFTASRWLSVWNEFLAATPQLYESGETVDASYIFYGVPHGSDIDYPYTLEMALFGFPNNAAFDAQKTHLFSAVRSGEMGFVRTQLGGTIYKLLPLGQSLISYSSRGIEVVAPTQDGAYQTTPLLHIGVCGPGAITGDALGHTFVTKAGTIYRISADLQLQRLGFEDQLFSLVSAATADEEFVTTTDPRLGEIYLTNSSTSYILAEGKLTKVLDAPTSIVAVGTSLVATNTEEEELVTNGTFTTDTGWTKGTNWTIAGGTANFATKAGTLVQSPAIQVDRPYRLNYTVSDWADASSEAALYVSLGDAIGQLVSDDGTYEDILIPGDVTNGLIFTPNILARGKLDTVSLNSARRWLLTTGILDFNTSGRVSLASVEIQGSNLKGMRASVYWRNGTGDDWRQTNWRRMGDRGFAILATTARQMKVSIQGYLFDNQPDGSQRSVVEGLLIRYKLPDRSSIRGTFQGVAS